MFITQVIIPVLIIAGVCFWAGIQFQKVRHAAQIFQPTLPVWGETAKITKTYG